MLIHDEKKNYHVNMTKYLRPKKTDKVPITKKNLTFDHKKTSDKVPVFVSFTAYHLHFALFRLPLSNSPVKPLHPLENF